MNGTTYAKGAIIGRTDREVMAKLKQQSLAGKIHSTGDLVLITKGTRAGQYAVPVWLIMRPTEAKAEIPRWARICVVLGAALTAPAVFLLLLAWVLTTLSALSLVVFLSTVLAGFLAWVKVRHPAAPRGATVTTTVTFH